MVKTFDLEVERVSSLAVVFQDHDRSIVRNFSTPNRDGRLLLKMLKQLKAGKKIKVTFHETKQKT